MSKQRPQINLLGKYLFPSDFKKNPVRKSTGRVLTEQA